MAADDVACKDSIGYFINKYRVSQKSCYNPAHAKPLFWIRLLDVQGAGTYSFIDFLFFDSL